MPGWCGLGARPGWDLRDSRGRAADRYLGSRARSTLRDRLACAMDCGPHTRKKRGDVPDASDTYTLDAVVFRCLL